MKDLGGKGLPDTVDVLAESSEELVAVNATHTCPTLTKSKKKRLRIKKNKLKQNELNTEPVENTSKYNSIVNNTLCNIDSIDKQSVVNKHKQINNSTDTFEAQLTDRISPCKADVDTPKKMNFSEGKSRENVLAERQAKKLAKQNAKKKDKPDSSVDQVKSISTINEAPLKSSNNQVFNDAKVLRQTKDSSVNSVICENVGSSNKNEEKGGPDKNIDVSKYGPVRKGGSDCVDVELGARLKFCSLNDPVKKEKSREEIIAEREAKKLAKQVKKQAGKDAQPIKKSDDLINLNQKHDDRLISKPGRDVVDRADVHNVHETFSNNQQQLPGQVRPFKEHIIPSKTREEIIAEREAKKLSKQQVNNGDAKTQLTERTHSDKPKTELAEKSKAELRAERRAKQEAQRAAKESQKTPKEAQPKMAITPSTVIDKKTKKSPDTKREIKTEEKVSEFKTHQHKLFSHLCVEQQPSDLNTVVHPAIVELGKKYASRVVSGSNARCVSLLYALKQVIHDYKASATSDLNRGLEAELAAVGTYLSRSRPLSVSMINSMRYLRSHLTQTACLPDDEAKRRLLEAIDTFIREQVDVAGQAISNTVQQKIANGDVILTYGCSSLVWRCLKESYLSGKEFSVVVVDGGPWYEGRELLRRLAALSIPCTYLLITAVGFAITKISKVLLGAHALLANGYVMSRTGSAMIALTASAHSVPVLVCCETYKFCERVQADAFVYNELGGCDEAPPKGVKWLSPVYDITPPDLVTAVVTELAILPCTSVPVVLRVKPSDLHLAS